MPFVWVFVSFSGCADDETFLRCWNFVLHTYGQRKKEKKNGLSIITLDIFRPPSYTTNAIVHRYWVAFGQPINSQRTIVKGSELAKEGEREKHTESFDSWMDLNGFLKQSAEKIRQMKWHGERMKPTTTKKKTEHTYGGEKKNTVHNKRITNMCHEIWIMNFIDDRKPTFAFQEINGA